MAEKVKIAYIGGGSKAWARIFINDLTLDGALFGEIALYDIDLPAAKRNKAIGEKLGALEAAKSKWEYTVHEEISTALTGADFVVISILPGTFAEMNSDVHAPEKYGIYQSVGDTAGPGGILRAMRTVPVYQEFAKDIEKYCPQAWVINFTNPMSICVKALYDEFPNIKAFGCCHEVFHAQDFLCRVISEMKGIELPDRHEIYTDASGVNHFTWITEAFYGKTDLLSLLPDFLESHKEGISTKRTQSVEKARYFSDRNLVKMDLFRRYGALGAAGDRHLAEFCPGGWYLKNPEHVESWGFALTPVEYRISRQAEQIEESAAMAEGRAPVSLTKSAEEAVELMKAVTGLCTVVSNVNMPNAGQMPGMTAGSIVETNCVFAHNSVKPVVSKALPLPVLNIVHRACLNIDATYEGIKERNLEKIFAAFMDQSLCGGLDLQTGAKLFIEMAEATRGCLEPYYDLSKLGNIHG